MSAETNQSVFPQSTKLGNAAISEGGLTLRDYFAAQVLPACYADYCRGADAIGFVDGWRGGVASDAYAMADAMLSQREIGGAQ